MNSYGKLIFNKDRKEWVFSELKPHVTIRLKNTFPNISKTANKIVFPHRADSVMDLAWFLIRYPMKMKKSHRAYLKLSVRKFQRRANQLEELKSPNYKPRKKIKIGNITLRDYQNAFVQMAWKVKRMVLGDDTGIGKTFQALALGSDPKCLPMLCVVPTHMAQQWKDNIDLIFPDATYHQINKQKPYTLPPADIYLTKYSVLGYWIDYWKLSNIKTVIFDEIQELRHFGTNKYMAAQKLSHEICEYSIGLSATPIFNYGDEAFSIFDLIKEGCLGRREEFNREWLDFTSRRVKDPKALGAYLQEQHLFLRRDRSMVKRELPPVNVITHYIETDTKELAKVEDLARALAIKSLRGPALEMGQSRRALDVMMRHSTGVAKARGVAQYVRMFLENGEKVCLVGWHRDVYDIWLDELKEFNPVLYTGSENEREKIKAVKKFESDESNLLILSLRSGAGIDGLQHYCSVIIFGELDWSPQTHKQAIGRFQRDRTDGIENNVTAIYLLSNEGSDPVMVDMLGIKESQAKGIFDPFKTQTTIVHSDETRLEILAKQILNKRGIKL